MAVGELGWRPPLEDRGADSIDIIHGVNPAEDLRPRWDCI